ncbi:protein FAR1-RELATED SEQUENCE 5-like [Bidens hawaiensis]|uniref:protein FAR1-RELATED SEQUENCE 5-like n=1 Tax=Bidens hawaiensis TaxID=980011 RepID=UPI00404A94F5
MTKLSSRTSGYSTSFLKHIKKQPKLVLTDQDAAVKQAVCAVFDQSIHRLCMWHIVKKIPLKWKLLIDDLNLSDHHWLTEIYAIREQRVPCYFREIQWCCLLKTTSRCESSNSLFKVNTSHANKLVQFLLCFGTALDRQRKTQLELDIETSTTTPKMPEKLPLEIHASKIYTRKIFLDVQKEIYRGMQCYITSSSEIDGVDFNAHDTTVSCSCMGFTRVGYLCRHAFCVFRYNQVELIPDKYLPAWWMRNVLPYRVHDISNRYSAEDDEESLKDIKDKVFKEFPSEPPCNSKRSIISELVGQPDTVDVTIKPPTGIRNKGSGTKRQVGVVEKLLENCNKNPRLCHKCNKYVIDHDSRNCEKVKAAKEAATAAVVLADAAVPSQPPTVPSTVMPHGPNVLLLLDFMHLILHINILIFILAFKPF